MEGCHNVCSRLFIIKQTSKFYLINNDYLIDMLLAVLAGPICLKADQIVEFEHYDYVTVQI